MKKTTNIAETNSLKCFLGLAPATYEQAKFIIISAPLEKTVSYLGGTKFGPEEIIKASPFLEFYDEDTETEPQDKGICTLKPLDFENKNIEQSLDLIYDSCKQIIKDKKIPYILGGEHSISQAPVKAFKDCIGNDFCVLHFDAHTDLRNSYENTKHSHAAVLKRIFELDIKHVSIGIRSVSKEEAVFIKENNIHICYAKNIDKQKIDLAFSKLTSKNIYITFDIDVFDPSLIPATGTPEPGGISWDNALYCFEKLKQLNKNIIGFDLVELSPMPNLEHPNFTAAKLIYKTMAYLF